MERTSPHQQLRVPTPNQHSLTFCEASPRDLKRWLGNLPKANLGEMARQLYHCLVELNQLITSTENRLQLLELLRPEVYFVCKHLEKHFLNQAIVLDERPRKVANLCQALQNHLAIGYKLIVTQEAQPFIRERGQIMALAIQRAMHSMFGPLVRASQLYCPMPEGLWLELHQLYRLATQLNLHQQQVREPQARHRDSLSPEQTYIQTLMLGCARTNQMRQSGIARVAEALEQWSDLVTLQSAELDSSLFAFSSAVDGPPRYKTLFPSASLNSLVGLDPRRLIDGIAKYLAATPQERENLSLPVPEGLHLDLLQHLQSAWGDIAERTFQRNPASGSLTLCIGMSPLHFFLSGEKPFNDTLKLHASAPAKPVVAATPTRDVWANAFDAERISHWEQGIESEEIQFHLPQQRNEGQPEPSAADNSAERPQTFQLPIVNLSPGGYCLSWPREVPGQLQAGEILGLQDDPKSSWSVAVVRWIRQVKGGGTQMGIELIAPQAQPCAVQLLRKAEQPSQYLRALLLPEIAVISQPASLITARLPFQEGNKVHINSGGEERRALLTRRKTSTGSFNQFEYRLLDQPARENTTPVTGSSGLTVGTPEDFDSLWKSL